METKLRFVATLLAIVVLIVRPEVPKINWRAIAALTTLLIAWVIFCLAVHPVFHH